MGEVVATHHPIRADDTIRQGREGNRYLKGALGEAATAAAKTDTFRGERYRRLVRRCGTGKSPGRSRSIDTRHHMAPPRGPLSLVHHSLGLNVLAAGQCEPSTDRRGDAATRH